MVPLQRCIRGGGDVTALKGITIPIINQSLLRRSRFTPVFMAGEKAATTGSRLALLPPQNPSTTAPPLTLNEPVDDHLKVGNHHRCSLLTRI